MLKPLTPLPAMRRGLRLYPDDPDDPSVFRVEFPKFGLSARVVFGESAEDAGTQPRLLMDVMSFRKRPDSRNPRLWLNGTLAAGATAFAVRRLCRRL